MTHEERIQAIADFGFTQSQAAFLVFVIRYAGVCIPRQYASFAGAPQGGKRCNALFEKLVRRGFAVPHDCVHNRARLYHLHHKALYLAIRELAGRYWRPASSRLWVERVMLLDALLPCAHLEWLTTTSERRAWLASVTASTAHDEAQGSSTTAVEDRPSGGFPRFPVGIESGARAVLVYLVTEPSIDRFRTFLHSNAALLRALSHWTIRLVFPRPLHRFYDAHQAVIREELETPLHPATVSELKWYFAHRRNATEAAVHPETQRFLDVGAKVFGAPRFSALYRRWLTQGDAVFEAVSSPAIADALAEKRGCVESLVLAHSYRHLLPLVTRRTISGGVEKGEERGDVSFARPQHPSSTPSAQSGNVGLL